MSAMTSGRRGDSVSTGPEDPGAQGQHTPLAAQIAHAIGTDGGWWPFDRFMHAALYTPGLGYYARGMRVFGTLPQDGSDFITAPELSPLFGRCVARQVAEGLDAAQSDTVWEFGAGSGALAEQVLRTLGARVGRYVIVDVSGSLRARQAERLAGFGDQVQWVDRLPEVLDGVLLGNEVLDAMPVRLFAFDGECWLERGVAAGAGGLAWADRATADRPPLEGPVVPGTVTERHDQAVAFVRTLAERLRRGLALFIDYGFPQAEYYHPQRTAGTLMCHRGHRADADPLRDVGLKDITAHVDFTAVALAAQDAGANVLGYTSQGRFLLNCGLADALDGADLPTRANAQKLITEHEMGELFKVLAIGRGLTLDPIGFRAGDRMHRL
jgi:SAM-dependent MidA family methyltransferase